MLKNIYDMLVANSGFIMMLIELVGVILVIVTLRKDRKIKEAEFISEYNFHFISSPTLVDMERKLETCYQKYKDNGGFIDNEAGYQEAWDSMVKIMAFEPPSATQGISRSYQKLINYLVYWESFAPLVLSGQVKLDAIDDAFGYRYFIVMNNPVVQKYELLVEAEYYRGCICLYEKWYDYRKKHKKEIPM